LLFRRPDGNPVMARVVKTEEKGSDVNLASHLLLDASRGDFEAVVVLSNDSDLLTPIRMVKGHFKMPVGVISPHPRPSRSLLAEATFYKAIRPSVLAACQLPPQIRDSTGIITKPREW
jgi:hypothetical protein